VVVVNDMPVSFSVTRYKKGKAVGRWGEAPLITILSARSAGQPQAENGVKHTAFMNRS